MMAPTANESRETLGPEYEQPVTPSLARGDSSRMMMNKPVPDVASGGFTKATFFVYALALVACLSLGGYAVTQILPGSHKAGSPALRHHAEDHHGEHALHSLHRTHHDHKKCKGGPAAACACLVKCPAFHRETHSCESAGQDKMVEMIGSMISNTLSGGQDICPGMSCIVSCAKKLGCYDDAVQKDCKLVNSTRIGKSCGLACDA